MTRLVYSAITSLDGYPVDADGSFDWAAPDEEVHAAVNLLERSVGTYLYGRRMYEVMVAWETMSIEGQSKAMSDYAHVWRADECHLFVTPVVVGGGTPALPPDVRLRLELLAYAGSPAASCTCTTASWTEPHASPISGERGGGRELLGVQHLRPARIPVPGRTAGAGRPVGTARQVGPRGSGSGGTLPAMAAGGSRSPPG